MTRFLKLALIVAAFQNLPDSFSDEEISSGRLSEHPVAVFRNGIPNYGFNSEQIIVINHLLKSGDVLDVKFRRIEFGPSLSGTLYYLRTGKEKKLERVNFAHHPTKESFLTWYKRFGDLTLDATLVWLDDKTALKTFTAMYDKDVPPGADPEAFAASKRSNAWDRTLHVELNEAKDKIHVFLIQREYYRIGDGVVYSGAFKEFTKMELPTAEALLSVKDGCLDAELDFSDESSLVAQGAVDLLEHYAVGWHFSLMHHFRTRYRDEKCFDGLVSSFKSLLEGLEATEFHFDSETSLGATFKMKVITDSPLQDQLTVLSGVENRMGALVDTESAATFHACFHSDLLSADSLLPKTPTGLVNLLSGDHLSSVAVNSLQSVVRESGSTAEILLKLSHSDKTDGVFFGGIQIADQQLQELANHVVDEVAGTVALNDSIAWTEWEGVPILQVDIPEQTGEYWRATTSLHFTHAFFTHDNGVLWFAVGSPGAKQTLIDCVSKIRSTTERVNRPALTFDLDLDRMYRYPQLDPVGVGALVLWMDRTIDIVDVLPFGPLGKLPHDGKPMFETIGMLEGRFSAHCEIDATPETIQVRFNLGKALANYILAKHVNAFRRVGEAAPVN